MSDHSDARAAWIAAAAAALLIANQVAGKAARDALFLSTWPVERLPAMLAVAAVVSLVVVARASGELARSGPRRAVPIAFVVSSLLHAFEAAIYPSMPKVATVVLFLHIAALGSVLISWFWSLVNERFDPRAARRRIAFIAGGGTLGGYLGGTAAAFVGDQLPPTVLIACLALVHGLAAPTLFLFSRSVPAHESHERGASPLEGVRIIGQDRYLRNLATIVLLGTMAAAGLDYVFKVEAVTRWGEGPPLLRFFAIYYTSLSFLTFLLQTLASRVLLERLGPTGTARLLPAGVVLLSGAALATPGLLSALVARAAEAAVRSSWYRSAYELFFVPVAAQRKRSAKLWIDVGADRLGDAIAGLAITGFVAATAAHAVSLTLGLSIVCGVGLLWRLQLLQRHYVGTLAQAIHRRAEDLNLEIRDESGHYTLLFSRAELELDDEARAALAAQPPPASVPTGPHRAIDPTPPTRVGDLRSGDVARVRAALAAGPLEPDIAASVVTLLAWDAVYVDALELLRDDPRVARAALLSALRDPAEVFAVRRRAPRALSAEPNEMVVQALARALADERFEVRYQCGQALWRISRRDPGLRPPGSVLLEQVERELRVGRNVRASFRLLDEQDAFHSELVDDVLRERVDRSLEHIFTLLVLASKGDGMRLAYRGVRSQDARLRGTALEYLEGALPPRIHRPLLDMLEGDAPVNPARRSTETVLAELKELNRSLMLEIADTRTEPPVD